MLQAAKEENIKKLIPEIHMESQSVQASEKLQFQRFKVTKYDRENEDMIEQAKESIIYDQFQNMKPEIQKIMESEEFQH